jgi:hypothetical protein
MYIRVFWDVPPCSLVDTYQTCCLHLVRTNTNIQSVESAEKLRESDRNLKAQHKELTSVALTEAVCRKYQRGVGMFRY